MTREESIIELGEWLKTPPGRYLLHWEQDRMDHAVADAFGYHALQLGMPGLDGLRANRMPHRWVASDSAFAPEPEPFDLPPPSDGLISAQSPELRIALHCDFDALPFPNQSLDLVVLPHALELARDPHLCLSEVERVLVPEGRVMILGFNPASLWGLRQRFGRVVGGGTSRAGSDRRADLFLPRTGDFLGYRRVRDWLRLLSFEVEAARFGCWRPPLRSQSWLDRTAWIESIGERWWPVLGAVYFIVAAKRVRGMRLVGLVRSQARRAKAAPAVAANRNQKTSNEESTTP